MNRAPLHPPGWYVELDGKRAGPFSIDQIQSLLQNGKIRPDQHVFENLTDNSDQLVSEFLDSFTDPAISLFDTLQAARVKKMKTRAYPVQALQEPTSWFDDWLASMGLDKTLGRIPGQAWLMLSMVGVIALPIWGSTQMLKRGSTMIATPNTPTVRDTREAHDTPAPARTTAPVPTNPVRNVLATPARPLFAPPVIQRVATPAPARILPRLPAAVARPAVVPDARDDRDRDRDARDRDPREVRDSRDEDPNANPDQQPVDRDVNIREREREREHDANGRQDANSPDSNGERERDRDRDQGGQRID